MNLSNPDSLLRLSGRSFGVTQLRGQVSILFVYGPMNSLLTVRWVLAIRFPAGALIAGG
jgi:hypothetical protein